MKLVRTLTLMILLAGFHSLASAQDITFFNGGGTFTSNNAQNMLFLDGTNGSTASSLLGVVGLGAGADCGIGGAPACSGTVSLQTGTLQKLGGSDAGTLLPLTGQMSSLGPGGSFDVAENAKNGLTGFTFAGSFSSETWACATGFICSKNVAGTQYTGTWTLVGSIVDATLTIGGHVYQIAQAATVQLTTISGTVIVAKNKPLKFIDNSGTTGFPSPVPEPSSGALSLFGCALIGIAALSKRIAASSSRIG
jgi:hypothetical protein